LLLFPKTKLFLYDTPKSSTYTLKVLSSKCAVQKKYFRQKKNRSNQQLATQNHTSSLTPEILAPYTQKKAKVAGVVAKAKLEA
jgi:hypothetical protein